MKAKKFLSTLLAAGMIMGMTACGSTPAPSDASVKEESQEEGTQEQASDETSEAASDDSGAVSDEGAEGDIPEEEWITLTFLDVGSGLFKEENSMIMKEIAKKTGVLMQQVPVAEERMNVMVASGEIEGDLVMMNYQKPERWESGCVIALDDLVAEYGPNILKNAGMSIDYIKEYRSFDTGALYYIPSHNVPEGMDAIVSVPHEFAIAPYVRWDYYAEMGYPEVHNEDEFLQMLRDMQDLHPTTEDGKRTYAIGKGMDEGNMLWSYFTFYSYVNATETMSWVAARDDQGNLLANCLDEDFVGWKAAEYYNKAWRLGILDPEAFTQKAANYDVKMTTGQNFYAENCWNNYNNVLAETVGPEVGLQPILTAFPGVYGGGEDSKYGWTTWCLGVTSTCEHPEAAIKWLDYLYTEEGARLLYSGMEGIHWDYIDGVPTMREEAIAGMNDENWNDENGLRKFHNYIGLNGTVLHSDGYPLDLLMTESEKLKSNKAIDDVYDEYYGVEYPAQAGMNMESEGSLNVVFWGYDDTLLQKEPTDDMKRLQVKVEEALKKALPKMIMCDTEEDFQKAKLEAIETLEKLGAEDYVNFIETNYEESKAKMRGEN